ncbi:transposase InsO family protein [Skermanella aerolata]
MLTNRGSCFTADGFEAVCRKLGIHYRNTKPYTRQTNGMVERFNDRMEWSLPSPLQSACYG